MKPFIKTLCITVFSFFLVFQIVSAEEKTPTETTVGIGQLMNNADQYPDSIMIQGIVSKVFPQDNLIGLIDNPNAPGCDVKKCTKPCDKAASAECPMKAAIDSGKTCPMAADKSCAKSCSMADAKNCTNSGFTLTLPVQWNGNMPEPSSGVRVVGKVTHKDGRLLFVAESITVMSN